MIDINIIHPIHRYIYMSVMSCSTFPIDLLIHQDNRFLYFLHEIYPFDEINIAYNQIVIIEIIFFRTPSNLTSCFTLLNNGDD